MTYKVIFSSGYTDDDEALMKGYRSDILILDETDNYYEANFVELNTIINLFTQDKICLIENNLVILHRVTKENILQSIAELHQTSFHLHWVPLSNDLIKKYYYPTEHWVTFEVVV